PNIVARDWILQNYSGAVERSLKDAALGIERIEWEIPASSNPDNTEKPISSSSPGCKTAEEQPLPVQGVATTVASSSLNENYTFGGFVVASCNRFAHAASQAVADSPGRTYNPLYLYGGVGLGKTHLLQAIGHAIKAANPSFCVAYLSLERFMNELINAI